MLDGELSGYSVAQLITAPSLDVIDVKGAQDEHERRVAMLIKMAEYLIDRGEG